MYFNLVKTAFTNPLSFFKKLFFAFCNPKIREVIGTLKCTYLGKKFISISLALSQKIKMKVATFNYVSVYRPSHDTLVHIAPAYMRNFARAFTSRIHKEWMLMKNQTENARIQKVFHRGSNFANGFFLSLVLVDEGIQISLKAGLHRPASETPFKWRFAGVPMIAQH